jgi:hypothetical protein
MGGNMQETSIFELEPEYCPHCHEEFLKGTVCGFCGQSDPMNRREIDKISREVNPTGEQTGSLVMASMIQNKINATIKRKRRSIMDLPYESDHDQEGITSDERKAIIKRSGWRTPWEPKSDEVIIKPPVDLTKIDSVKPDIGMFMAMNPFIRDYNMIAAVGVSDRWNDPNPDINKDGKLSWWNRLLSWFKKKQLEDYL